MDVSGNVEIRGEVDARNVGLYYVAYIYTNDDGVQTRLNRTVIVCDPTVETDIAGRYATVEGTYRLAGGNEVPFPGFGVNIYKIGPGFLKSPTSWEATTISVQVTEPPMPPKVTYN